MLPSYSFAGTCAYPTSHGSTCTIACYLGYQLSAAPRLCWFGVWQGALQQCLEQSPATCALPSVPSSPLAAQPLQSGFIISAGWDATCFVTVSGFQQCFGHYQVTTFEDIVSTSEQQGIINNFVSTSVGYDNACWCVRPRVLSCDVSALTPSEFGRITAAGAVICTGFNEFGQRVTPTGSDFVQVSVGFYHICALTTGGTLVCW